ncbi:hypothetical protein O9G_001937 [Rozella allomycis CSF55]|uniref:Uncharacterized protein n=1 Tax=Rozella allomycis (strain CSF55) TaxID=988480 RepID=A0A075ATP3_ROZAC|nr:hypothetical protein O9G_001937 [Rozella allomycis CSF55]|eukprot:EPZ31927.1 hypothetical protein O9G_001937 [Rozella allomycis CSF55]
MTVPNFNQTDESLISKVKTSAIHVKETMQLYVQRYPPLAAFLFVLLLISSLPITIYLVFSVTSAAIVLSIALIGFALVEGFLVVVSGGILLFILAIITGVTTFIFFWITLAWAALKGTSATIGKINLLLSHASTKLEQVNHIKLRKDE